MSLLTLLPAELQGGVWKLSLSGSLDASTRGPFELAVEEILHRGKQHLIVDLKHAQYISSTGFSAILLTLDFAKARGGQMVFVGTPPHLKEMFKMLGLEGPLAFAPDEDTALAYLAACLNESTD